METKERKTDDRDDDKQPYERPALKEWGTVTDLTSSGGASAGGDPLGGSVDCL